MTAQLGHNADRSSWAGGDPLLERETALEQVMDALSSAEAGHGQAVFVEGAAGIGKTVLLDVGQQAAEASGFRVTVGTGSPMERDLPFGLIDQALLGLCGDEVDQLTALEGSGDPAARFFRTFRWVAGLTRSSPVLLALDDLHWADRDSMELLGFLGRRLKDVPVVLLAAARPEPGQASALARELAGCGHARLVSIESLSPRASAALLERLAGSIDPRERDRVCGACAGTPLLIEEAARALNDRGSMPASAWTGQFAQMLLLERFAGVDEDGFSYLQAASILGVRFRPSYAGALAGLDEAGVGAVHASLLRARLLEDLGGGWASFSHPLFAQALQEAQTPSARERLHSAAFGLLADREQDAARAAEHALAGELHGDPRAIEVTTRAGREALMRGALQAACTHLGNAVELAGDTADTDLLLDHAGALLARGRVEDARDVCEQLLASAGIEPGVRARTLMLLARTAMLVGHPDDSQRLYDEAAEVAMLVDPASCVVAMIDAMLTCQASSSVTWGLATISRALELLPAGAPERQPLEFLRAFTKLMLGDSSESNLLVRERDCSAARQDAHGGQSREWNLAVHALMSCKLREDFDRARELFEHEFKRAVEDGAPLLMGILAGGYAETLLELGRPSEALELVDRAQALTDVATPPWLSLPRTMLLIELGRDAEARPIIDALQSFQASVPPGYFAFVSLWLDLVDSRRLLVAGEPEQASTTMLHAAEIAGLAGLLHPRIVPWAGVAIEAHVEAGHIDRARALIDDLDERSRTLDCRSPQAQLKLGQARLAAAEGHVHEADQRFSEALAIFAELPTPVAHAEALLAYGAHLRRSGRPRDAREPLARALALVEPTGVERVVKLACAELAAAGGRRRRREVDASALTAQEERVAAFAAEGMTNKQIAAALHLSPRTVGHHLGRVYAKLAIASRRELIARRHKHKPE